MIESRIIINPTAQRFVTFEDVRYGKKLSGSSIHNQKAATGAICSLICGFLPKCRSFNFCGRENCQLNSDDLFSIGKNETFLDEDLNCDFWAMKRDDLPECMEMEVLKNVRNDLSPGLCEINYKRVDGKFNYKKVQSSTVFRVYKVEEGSILHAHGGFEAQEEETWLEIGPNKVA